MSKKEESRFNIRFNPADPTHQMAIEILSHAGRSKANLIANAIAFYLKGAGRESAAYMTKSLSLEKMPKIKSEKRRDKKPPKPQSISNIGCADEHEVIVTAAVNTEEPEISQITTFSNEDNDESEDNGESLTEVTPELQGAVLNMLDMFRG